MMRTAILITGLFVLASGTNAAHAATAESASAPVAGAASQRPDEGDFLRLLNGDRLHGTFDGFEGDKVKWRRADFKPAPEFRLDRVAELRLVSSRAPKMARRQTVELTNGDRLEGDIVSLDDTTLRLDTAYAGVLDLKRPMVRNIVNRSALADVIYAGPTGPEDWTAYPNPESCGWRYRDGAFISTYPFESASGRDIDFPDKVSIEFDLSSVGYPTLRVAFCADDYQGDWQRTKGYVLVAYGSRWMLSGVLGATLEPTQDLSQYLARQPVRVSICMDRTRRCIILLLNNEEVKTWITGDVAMTGKKLYFSAAHAQPAMRISNIVVKRWVPMESAAVTGGESRDRVYLASSERVDGKIVMTASNATITAAGTDAMTVPLNRIVSVALPAPAAAAPAGSNDTRVAFADGSRLTLELRKTAGRSVSGTIPACGGEVTVSLDTATRLQFRVGDPRWTEDAKRWSKPDVDDKLIGAQRP